MVVEGCDEGGVKAKLNVEALLEGGDPGGVGGRECAEGAVGEECGAGGEGVS